MVLRVKPMSRPARLAPLSATTPVGCSPPAVAQIRLSWTWRPSSKWGGGVESGRSPWVPVIPL
jgi:hypothetical protein